MGKMGDTTSLGEDGNLASVVSGSSCPCTSPASYTGTNLGRWHERFELNIFA